MKKSILLLSLVSLLTVSCNLENLISLVPESQITPESYFKTAEDLQLFSNTFYNNLLEKEPFAVESDVFVKMNPSNLIRGGNDRTVPATGGGWGRGTGAWGDLRKMNTLLGNIGNCQDAAAVKEYTAVVKFWRAYFYATMIRKFGDVPWYDVELGSADEALYKARDSREEVLRHMIEDIDCAIEDLPGKAAAPQTAYRINKYTAMLVKADFCLFEGTFRKYHSEPAPFEHSYTAADGSTHDYKYYLDFAAKAAKMLIDSGAYTIHSTGNPNTDYLTLFNSDNASTDEIILAINFDRDLKIKHDCGRAITNQTANRFGMTKKLVDQYLMKDGSRFTDKPGWNVMPFAEEVADRDPRLAQTIRTPGYSWKNPGTSNDGPEFAYCQTGYETIKYIPAYSTKPYSTDNCFNDMPVFRYAEVLLDYAEALAELGTLTQGDLDISVNRLRDRVGMPHLDMAAANANPDPYLMSEETGYPNVTGGNKGVILEIRRERAIELFQEGYGRYFDLMRWKAGYCLNQPMYGMYIGGPGEYNFGDDSKYTFYTGTTNASGVRYKIYDPASGDESATDEIFYLVDPNTGKLATAGVRDALHSVSHSFDESKHYFYPIPENELLLNPDNLKQNPNW
ncbi:MAG: RagB/SusD family nutrient uptake outer membrane protein [Bacteroidales bacterium]|nr:RagB/SusD family nutrient uptake outer membrane protein [Bacteroidales bacterium]MBR0291206.1 RagB/SusD family nutrient uptake outer membrane protein [Bacteroidales bacterium]